MKHLHRCHFHRYGGPQEQCQEMWECECDHGENEPEPDGFCPRHELLARELEAILDEGAL